MPKVCTLYLVLVLGYRQYGIFWDCLNSIHWCVFTIHYFFVMVISSFIFYLFYICCNLCCLFWLFRTKISIVHVNFCLIEHIFHWLTQIILLNYPVAICCHFFNENISVFLINMAQELTTRNIGILLSV